MRARLVGNRYTTGYRSVTLLRNRIQPEPGGAAPPISKTTPGHEKCPGVAIYTVGRTELGIDDCRTTVGEARLPFMLQNRDGKPVPYVSGRIAFHSTKHAAALRSGRLRASPTVAGQLLEHGAIHPNIREPEHGRRSQKAALQNMAFYA